MPTAVRTGHEKVGWAPERVALWLVGGTMAYNSLEAVVAVWAGREAESIALVGFGLDSVIELAAGAILYWRLLSERRGLPEEEVETREIRARRFVGATFLALAAYVLSQAAWTLWVGRPPEESLLGIALAVASLVLMPLIAWGKFRTARQLKSRALEAEAKETLACAYLSFTLLLGLLGNALAGWWWADPVAAVLMVPWLVREGLEGIREGEF